MSAWMARARRATAVATAGAPAAYLASLPLTGRRARPALLENTNSCIPRAPFAMTASTAPWGRTVPWRAQPVCSMFPPAFPPAAAASHARPAPTSKSRAQRTRTTARAARRGGTGHPLAAPTPPHASPVAWALRAMRFAPRPLARAFLAIRAATRQTRRHPRACRVPRGHFREQWGRPRATRALLAPMAKPQGYRRARHAPTAHLTPTWAPAAPRPA